MNPRREHFDAIIVGSGFGGSVMAWRLAEAGLRALGEPRNFNASGSTDQGSLITVSGGARG